MSERHLPWRRMLRLACTGTLLVLVLQMIRLPADEDYAANKTLEYQIMDWFKRVNLRAPRESDRAFSAWARRWQKMPPLHQRHEVGPARRIATAILLLLLLAGLGFILYMTAGEVAGWHTP